jgi:uncharacterized protein YegP (UPF0339 family)/DNA/RNA endonuclease YhcR with UshA esterase domain
LSQPQFEIYKDNTGKYRWRLRASNGEIVAASEAYESKDGAEKGIESVKKAAPQALIEDLFGSTLGASTIRLKYDGRCLKCGKTIPEGTQAFWESEKGVWHIQCDPKPPSERPSARARPSNRIMALTVLFVLSALTFGYSVGSLGVFRALPAPVTIRLTETRTVTVTSEIRVVSSSTFATSETTSTQKWANPNTQVISYLDAGKYIGQTKTVEGKIVKTNRYEPGNVIFLNFHDPYEGYFTVIIWREYWKNFAFAPEVFYSGKEVRVTGLIKDYRGAPQIEATGPKQIEVAYMGFSYPTAASDSRETFVMIFRSTNILTKQVMPLASS